MKLGVTGTRNKPTFSQCQKFFSFLCKNRVNELHHGDCTGWDKECHDLASHYGIKTIIHPPNISDFRAFCAGDVVLPERPFLDRNKDIVNSVDFLIAAPDGPERQRSGTWSTVRYAKKVGVKGVVFL